MTSLIIIALSVINILLLGLLLKKHYVQDNDRLRFDTQLDQLNKQQIQSWQVLQDSLHKGMAETRQQLQEILSQHNQRLTSEVSKLSEVTHQRLHSISQQVEQRLADGFAKTTATFNDVVKRLALIDAAQQRITELSNNVVNLQSILADKKSRGAFGEVQLANLIHNILPESKFAMQYTLPNGKRADCMLFLPPPTGHIAIDAKFPLECYQDLINPELTAQARQQAESRFKAIINKHIQDIAEKYIIPGETADGAIMFIPAEAVFAEIHAHFPELVTNSHKARVWLVSPTTMMAVLTTARAVLKDEATRKQVHIIQEHLRYLAKDFERFEKRMDNLARHIKQAHDDVSEVHTSAQKITNRFTKIEKVELGEQDALLETD
ncbi:MAG: DNA recombination protein RmuC [Gammaproteobacteria bacterium]